MSKHWETFKTLCAMAILGLLFHDALVWMIHDVPVYWINW